MMIHLQEEPVVQPEGESLLSDETSLSHFCEFVDYYTRHSTDPMYTAAVCEQQAEGVAITPQDVSRETVQMLIDTLLLAIDHLEKKWLDEQIRREDLEQMYCRNEAPPHAKELKWKPEKKEKKRFSPKWIRRIRKHAKQGNHAPQQEVAAW